MGDVSIGWVCSRKAERAHAFLEEIGSEYEVKTADTRAMDDWEQAVGLDGTDGVYIATPNTFHFAMARRALECGRHVLLEYPHATKAGDGQRLLELSRQKNVVLHVGLTYRYGARFKALRDVLQAKGDAYGLGAPHAYVLLDATGGTISRWFNRDELTGGTYISSMFDHLDEAVGYFGRVQNLFARYRSVRDANGVIQEDCCALMLVFEGGCTAQLTYTRGYPLPGPAIRKTVICEKGHVDVDAEGLHVFARGGKERVALEETDALYEETADFVEGIRQGRSVDTTAQDAQYALEIAERAHQTAARG
jgi:biliverdin reductase